MSQANAYEQYILELINAERAKTGAQPLAFDGDLNEAAELHSDWMLDFDTFSHTGANGSSAGDRMTAAGYRFYGSWTWGENVAWMSARSPSGWQDEALGLHTNLMNSSGHRANILNANFREIGVGFETGVYKGYHSAMLTENFAKTGGNPFLTGVAFDDKDGDRVYDVGEALGGVTVTVTVTNTSTGQVLSTQAGIAGGYELELAAGTYKVTFVATGFSSQTSTVTIGSKNVKADWIDPAAAGTPTPAPTIKGTDGSNSYNGTTGNDSYDGLAGNDTIRGQGGNDNLIGGSGHDFIYGGIGLDTLTGGTGSDRFVFDTAPTAANADKIIDFSTVDDRIQLDNAVFTAFGSSTGWLSSAAFQRGAVALDASDRILYDPGSGKLFYDADGTGASAPVLVAELSTNLNLTASDIQII
jgi:Ca2+-binding RTX toxin-like protein